MNHHDADRGGINSSGAQEGDMGEGMMDRATKYNAPGSPHETEPVPFTPDVPDTGEDGALTPAQMDRWKAEYEYWTAVGVLIDGRLVRWYQSEWAEFHMSGTDADKTVTVQDYVVDLLDRLLENVETKANMSARSSVGAMDLRAMKSKPLKTGIDDVG